MDHSSHRNLASKKSIYTDFRARSSDQCLGELKELTKESQVYHGVPNVGVLYAIKGLFEIKLEGEG